jgi:hypothetical protein
MHGLNHELGNLLFMLRTALATGRRLLLWADEGPRLHPMHNMNQPFDAVLGSWRGAVLFPS